MPCMGPKAEGLDRLAGPSGICRWSPLPARDSVFARTRMSRSVEAQRSNLCQPRFRRSAKIAAVAAPEREARSVEAGGGEAFSWTRRWYPMAPLKQLEEGREEGFESGLPQIQRMAILGRDIVVWKDGEGRWRAVEDRCPHRLTALSLGSVLEDGTLACRYHGWCFNGRGECTHIPQAVNAASEATACASTRSKIAAFPTLEAHGLLWVWPDDSPTSWIDSAAASPVVGKVTDPNTFWLALDYPVSHATLLENTFDPAHVNYLHNGKVAVGVGGAYLHPEGARIIHDFRQVGETTANGGFFLTHSTMYKSAWDYNTTLDFCPPCLNIMTFLDQDGTIKNLEMHYVPMRPGLTRIMFSSTIVGGPPEGWKPKKESIAEKVSKTVKMAGFVIGQLPKLLLPMYVRVGLFHLGDALSNQDIIAGHTEDRQAAGNGGSWRSQYHLPTPSNVGVLALRNWVDRYAGGGPTWFGDTNEREIVLNNSPSDLFNRWERHSKWCPSCRKSLKWFGKVEVVASTVAAAFFGLGLVLAAIRTASPRLALAAVVAGAAALLARFQVQKLRMAFISAIPSTGIPEYSHEWPN